MDYQLSTSIIQNGMPLVPPLITNDIATEIQYYKQLAIAVAEKLRSLEVIREAAIKNNNNESNKNNFLVPMKNDDVIVDLDKSRSSEQPKSSSSETLVDVPTKDESACLIDFGSDLINKDVDQVCESSDADNNFKSEKSKVELVDKSISDEEKSRLNETLQEDSTFSDAVTASTDLNQYLNTSVSTKTDTTETTPENWKPQVPKTLDIVPITLDQSRPPDKSCSADEDTPKLVRRGSYVLDRPSPVLLAHIQNESPSAEYKPTTSAKAIKRKEWNISQIKADLKAPANIKDTSARLNSAVKSRRGNNSNIPCQRVCKSVSNSKSGSPLDIYQTKSVDCIQTIFAKECYSPTTARSRTSHQKYSSVYSANGLRNNGLKKSNRNTPILNLANKLSESLGSLNSPTPKAVKRPEKKIDKDSNVNNNNGIDKSCVRSSDGNVIAKKQKPTITSEKIVTVFREIQDTHKKQMLELMTRQQKEQIQMQENFKKQQILLLAQIRKAFPEISISALTEAISSKGADHTSPVSSRENSEKSELMHKDQGVDKPQLNGINCHKNDMYKSHAECDYSSREQSTNSCRLKIQSATPSTSPYYQSYCQATQTFDGSPTMFTSRSQLSNVKSIDDIPVGTSIRRRSSVSRQLFPSDSKSLHAPVLDNSLYTEKHIKAAVIINAHARGFLVRRLMRTEKVIALKNTYREALHCMLRLHIDAPLNLPELNFHQRLQLQCDAASMNIVDLFSQTPTKRMEIIAHDREIKKARSDRPSSARSYSFATQRTLARKKMKEMGSLQNSVMSRSCPARTRCQTWTSNTREKKVTTSLISQGIKRSISAHAVRKPWR